MQRASSKTEHLGKADGTAEDGGLGEGLHGRQQSHQTVVDGRKAHRQQLVVINVITFTKQFPPYGGGLGRGLVVSLCHSYKVSHTGNKFFHLLLVFDIGFLSFGILQFVAQPLFVGISYGLTQHVILTLEFVYLRSEFAFALGQTVSEALCDGALHPSEVILETVVD
jgi:hypothetical protein